MREIYWQIRYDLNFSILIVSIINCWFWLIFLDFVFLQVSLLPISSLKNYNDDDSRSDDIIKDWLIDQWSNAMFIEPILTMFSFFCSDKCQINHVNGKMIQNFIFARSIRLDSIWFDLIWLMIGWYIIQGEFENVIFSFTTWKYYLIRIWKNWWIHHFNHLSSFCSHFIFIYPLNNNDDDYYYYNNNDDDNDKASKQIINRNQRKKMLNKVLRVAIS